MKQFFGYIWYGSSSSPTTASETTTKAISVDTGQVINDSMDTIDSLTMKRSQYLNRANKAYAEAKLVPKTDKAKRLALLKQQQQFQRQAATYDGMISNMEQTAQSLDAAAVSIQLARTMREAHLQMNDQMEKVRLEDIDEVLDDLGDTVRDVNEMAVALARPIGGSELPEDDELLGQLDEMDAVEAVVDLPSVDKLPKPTRVVATAATAAVSK